MPIYMGNINTHRKEYLGSTGVSDGSKLEILIAHSTGGYHKMMGTIYVVGMCSGHSTGRVGLIRHFQISVLATHDEGTSDIIDYEDAFSYISGDMTVSALDNADNIADSSSDNVDDFAMTIENGSGHSDWSAYVWLELFGDIVNITPSVRDLGL